MRGKWLCLPGRSLEGYSINNRTSDSLMNQEKSAEAIVAPHLERRAEQS